MLKVSSIINILLKYLLVLIESHELPISTFFLHKNIGSVIMINCLENDSSINSFKELEASGDQGVLLSSKSSFTDLYPTFDSKHYRTGIYLNLVCNSSQRIFRMMSDNYLFNLSYSILASSNDYEEAIELLNDSTISFDSDVTLFVDNNLYDIYKKHFSLPIISTIVGKYEYSTFSYKKAKKRNNFEGVTINAGLVWTGKFKFNNTPEDLETILDYTYEPELEFLSRYGYTMHRILQEAYKFMMNISLYDDWGYFNEKLQIWDTGMFGGIADGKIDLGMSISRPFGKRLDVSFCFPPFLKYRTCFVFKHPSLLAHHTALIKPFTFESWLCTLSVLLLTAIFLWFIRLFNVGDTPSNESDFTSSLILALGTVCQQGLASDSLRLSMRILYTFLLIMSLLIYIIYGAAVVGFLLLPSPKTINTVQKLMESPIKPYAENLAYHKTHFTGNFSDKAALAYEAIKDKKTRNERWIDLLAGIQKVKRGKIALYAQDTNLYRVIEKTFSNSEVCSLTEIEIITLGASTVVRKKSPYKEILYQGMMLVREAGLLNRIIKKWQAQRPGCYTQEKSPSVNLEATIVAHIIYSTGLVLSLIILALEIYYVKIKAISN